MLEGIKTTRWETVIKLFGNREENIQNILNNLNIFQPQRQLVKTVLSILYSKIEKIRTERNSLKSQITQLIDIEEAISKQISGISEENYLLKKLIKDHIEDSSHKLTNSSPAPLQNYQSCNLFEHHQAQIPSHSASAFVASQQQVQGRLSMLIKKYNLTPEQFKKALLHYIQQEQKIMQKLETESQKNLYRQSKKSHNYENWLRKVKKDCARDQNKR